MPHASRFIPITRLERAVGLELLLSFGVGLAVLTPVSVMQGLYRAVVEGVPIGLLARLAPLQVLCMVPWILPTAFVVASIMVYSRMAVANELMALRASGVHLWRVLAPAAALALALCGVCGVFRHHLVPRLLRYQRWAVKEAGSSEQVAALRFGDPVMAIGDYVVYMGDVEDDDSFRDILIVQEKVVSGGDGGRGTGRRTERTCVYAPRGWYEYSDETRQLVFHLESDPSRATPENPNAGRCLLVKSVHQRRKLLGGILVGGSRRDFEKAFFRAAVIPVQLRKPSGFRLGGYSAKYLETVPLMLRLRKRLRDLASGRFGPADPRGLTPTRREYVREQWHRRQWEARRWHTEIHRRSALSLSPLLLTLVAVPIAGTIRKGRRIVAFTLAVVLVLGYYALMGLGSRLGVHGMLPVGVSVWGVTGLLGVGGALLLRNMLRR